MCGRVLLLLFVVRYLQRCPLVFFKNDVYPIATQCALAALTFNHRDAYASIQKYLRDLILSSDQTEVLQLTKKQACINYFAPFY